MWGLLRGKAEHLVLTRPFRGQIGEARNPHATRESALNSRFDEIGGELEGAEAGDRGLYITLSETEAELRVGAASHGWRIGEEIEVFELVPPERMLDPNQQQSLLYSSDLELGETTKLMFEAIDRCNPSRIVLAFLPLLRFPGSELVALLQLSYVRQSRRPRALMMWRWTRSVRPKSAAH